MPYVRTNVRHFTYVTLPDLFGGKILVAYNAIFCKNERHDLLVMHVRLLLACAVVLVRAGSSQRTARAVTAEVTTYRNAEAVLAWLDGGGRVDATYADD